MMSIKNILKYFFVVSFLASSVGLSAASDPKADFLQSLQENQHLLLDLINPSVSVRQDAARFFRESAGYRLHTSNYLAYVRSINGGTDIFSSSISFSDIETLRERDGFLYEKLLNELFGLDTLSGKDQSFFYMHPELYFTMHAKKQLEIKPDLTFPKLFEMLKSTLPSGTVYRTTLELNGNVPGGVYDSERDVITFGDFPLNISTVMGFIHEFGHSVFLIKTNDDLADYYAGGFNEAFAELWASQISRLPFITEIFTTPNTEFIEKYAEFRRIFGRSFYLMTLKMERVASRSRFTADRYLDWQRREGWKFLRVRNTLPVIPLAAQEPGVLPLYLVVGFVDHTYRDQVGETIASDLLHIGAELAGDTSVQHFKNLLSDLIRNFNNDN